MMASNIGTPNRKNPVPVIRIPPIFSHCTYPGGMPPFPVSHEGEGPRFAK